MSGTLTLLRSITNGRHSFLCRSPSSRRARRTRQSALDFILESLREAPLAEIEDVWDIEIEKRVAAYDRGELETFSAENVFAVARRLAQ